MKRALIIVAGLLLLLVVVVAAIPFVVDVNRFRPEIEAKLSDALGREVNVGEISLKIFQGAVSADNIAIADHPGFSKSAFLKAKELRIGVELWPLIANRTLNVSGLTIDQPEVNLVQSEAGVWNYASLGTNAAPKVAAASPAAKTAGAAMAFLVQSIKLTNGKLTVSHLGSKAKALTLDKVDIAVTNFSPLSAFPFTIAGSLPAGGTLKLDGTIGPFAKGDASETPADLKLNLEHIDLAASGLVDPSVGMSGIAAIEGELKSTGKSASVTGKATVEHLLVARNGTPATKPVVLDYAVEHNLKTQAGKISRGDVHLGAEKASLTGTYDLRVEPGSLSLKLAGPSLAVTELVAMLPALGVTLPKGATIESGTGLADVSIEGPMNHLTTSGTAGLDATKLANYDLGTKLKVLSALTGIKATQSTEIQKLRVTFKSTTERTDLSDITMVVPSIGTLTGNGTIVEKTLALKMNAALGSSNIPFAVEGSVDDPKFKPDVKAVAKDQLNKLVGGKDGSAKAASGLVNRFFGKKK